MPSEVEARLERILADYLNLERRLERLERYDSPIYVPWTSYQATSTIVGWDTRSVNLLYYKRVGDLVYIEYNFYGVSDATTISFTLPYTHNGVADMYELVSWVHDNGVTATSPGLLIMSNGSAIATVYKTMASGGWTNINNKGIYGNFWYRTTQAV